MRRGRIDVARTQAMEHTFLPQSDDALRVLKSKFHIVVCTDQSLPCTWNWA